MEVIKFITKNKFNEKLVCEINKADELIKNRPTLLIVHALTGKKENKTIKYLAKNIPQFGFDTLQFDFSGHGESEGKIEEATVSKQIEDINSVLQTNNIINKENIILVGNSFSVITTLALAKDNRIKGIILLSGRADYMKYIDTLERKEDKYILIDDKLVEQKFIEDYKKYNPLKNISNLKIPVLIIHGEKDDVIPVSDAEQFYSACKSKNKQIKIINGADHRYSDNKFKEEILKEIENFLYKYFN